MAGPYEDPMGGQMPANPGGGGLPGQPRNPATGGYPSRDIAPSPLQPGQMANPDLYARSRQNQQWQDMMRRQRFGGMVGGPGMWGGGMFPGGGMRGPRGPVDPGFNIGGTPYVAPTFDSPDAAGNPAQKAADIARYKAGIRGSAGQTASAMNGGGMTNAFYDTRPPDWMDPARAAEMRGRVSGRVMDQAAPDMVGGAPQKDPYRNPGPLPPWFGGPTGGLFGPPQWGGGGGYRPAPGMGGGATPPGGAKPGGPPQYGQPGGPPSPDQQQGLQDLGQYMTTRQAQPQPGAQPEPAVYPA